VEVTFLFFCIAYPNDLKHLHYTSFCKLGSAEDIVYNQGKKQVIWTEDMNLIEGLYYIGYLIKKHQDLKHRKRLPCRVISIGNITVGGTGKTPAAVAIAEEARKRGLVPGILTRG